MIDDTRTGRAQTREAGRPAPRGHRSPARLAAPAHRASLLGMSEMRPWRRPSALGAERRLSGWQDPPGEPAARSSAQVREALENYRTFKRNLEAISELNQFLLRLDREESKQQERES